MVRKAYFHKCKQVFFQVETYQLGHAICWLCTICCDTRVYNSLKDWSTLASAWTDAETFKLNELWGDQSIQEQPEGCRKCMLKSVTRCGRQETRDHMLNVMTK